MAALPQFSCPSLDAADEALVASQDKRRRKYLGMSAIGGKCERALWYGLRWVQLPAFDVITLKRFEDGHRSEELAIARLKRVPAFEVHDTDEDGEQFGFKDLGGHFSGHMDGVILGLVQAPKTWHVLEIKASEKWQDLDKARQKVGEKNALAEWNPTYYAQAVLYMDYAGIERHYLVCVSPGGRRWTAVRTDADPIAADQLKAKAERIIFTDHAPSRIGSDATAFACKFCDYKTICHDGAPSERNCRTCLSSTAMREGGWKCERYGHELSVSDQETGCNDHRYLPGLVPGEQIDADAFSVTYRMKDGSTWVDRGQSC